MAVKFVLGISLLITGVLCYEVIELHQRVAKLEELANESVQIEYGLYNMICDLGTRVCKTEEKLGIEPQTVRSEPKD